MPDDPPAQFPTPPAHGQHVFVVCRFDGIHEGSDPTESFNLTRGYWTESEAQHQATRLNAEDRATASRYYVLPVRVPDASA